jgi:hypothetical protein
MGHGRNDRRFPRAIAVAAAATALFAAWVGFGIGGDTSVRYVDDLATVLAVLAATFFCFRAGMHHAGGLGRFWWLLGSACAAWSLGEGIWAVYDLGLNREVPVPSWADVGYLGAIPLAVAALLFHPAMRAGFTHKARSVFDGLVVATALLFLSWSLVLGPLERSTDLTTSAGIVSLAYPFGDVVIVFFVVLAVRGISVGDRLPLWWLLGGLLVTAFTDSLYAYLVEVKSYESGKLVDTGWFAGYLGIGLGALCSEVRDVVPRKAERAAPTLAPFLTPFIPMLIALGVAGIQTQLGHQLDDVSRILAFVLVLLVLIRQLLLLVDLLAPGRRAGVGVIERLAYIAAKAPVPEQAGPDPSALRSTGPPS